MAGDSTITDAIKKNAAGPAKAMIDGESAEQHSLKDLVAADEHLCRKRDAGKPLGGARFTRIRPGGPR